MQYKKLFLSVRSIIFNLCTGALMLFLTYALMHSCTGTLVLYAQVPKIINFQARLYDTSSKPITGNYNITFSIYDVATGDTPLWTETHTTSLTDGLVNVLLGEKTSLNIPFDKQYYLEIKINDQLLSPRQKIAAVGYAFRAIDAEKLGGIPAAEFVLKEELSEQGTINASTNPVDWTKLKNVPSDFADGIDDTTTGGTDYYVKLQPSSTQTIVAQNVNTTPLQLQMAASPIASPFIIKNATNGTIFEISPGGKITTGSIPYALITDREVVTEDIVDGTIKAIDIDTTQIQRRITQQCLGQVMVGINENGTVICEPDDTGAGGNYVILAPTTAQADSTTNPSIFINKTGTSGNLLRLQQAGVDKFVVDYNGIITTPSVESTSIKDNEILTEDIADYQITPAKLAANAVTTDKIFDGTITDADISPTANISASKINTGGATNLVVSLGKYGDATTLKGHVKLEPGANITITRNDTNNSLIIASTAAGGDMYKSVYDTNNNNKVDDADKLGGQLPFYYAPATHTHSGGPGGSIIDGTITDADISPTANISASKINSTGLDADTVDGQHGPFLKLNVSQSGTSITELTGNWAGGDPVLKVINYSTGANPYGIMGVASWSDTGAGVYGYNGKVGGVYPDNCGVKGYGPTGVWGQGREIGVWGSYEGGPFLCMEGDFPCSGVVGVSSTGHGGVFYTNSSTMHALYVKSKDSSDANPGLKVKGSAHITGTLTKPGGFFLIDHPLDPQNKVLRHSFVESPDMKNVYDGIVTLNENGEAVVELPEYFEALNINFRYQLTPVGRYAPLYIKQEIKNNQFVIASANGNKDAALKVSWQVTGIRNDIFAQMNPIIVEEEKGQGTATSFKKGELIHKDAYEKYYAEKNLRGEVVKK